MRNKRFRSVSENEERESKTARKMVRVKARSSVFLCSEPKRKRLLRVYCIRKVRGEGVGGVVLFPLTKFNQASFQRNGKRSTNNEDNNNCLV